MSTLISVHFAGRRAVREMTEARLGCDMAQGYYMSPPLPAAEFGDWIVQSRYGVR